MAGRHASEIGAWDNGALYAAAQPINANYLSNAGYDTVIQARCTLSAQNNCTASSAD